MASVDRLAPIQFLRTGYGTEDWLAVFLKTYRTGMTSQRVVPASIAANDRFQSWLRFRNAHGWNIYVSVNAVAPGRRRTRRDIAAVRHVFLEEDRDGSALLARLAARIDLPPCSYVLQSSPGRIHVFWRVRGFLPDRVELLQKQLAREVGTDLAATSYVQTTRLPGFMNHKRQPPHLVTIDYHRPLDVFTPANFPAPLSLVPRAQTLTRRRIVPQRVGSDNLERARRFLTGVAPAIAGQHGDVRTFRICCRLVRGFALTSDEALSALADWNGRCNPPWSRAELLAKLRNAERYGREPKGGLLSAKR